MVLIGLHDGLGPVGPAGFSSTRANGDLEHLLVFLLRWIKVADEVAVDLKLAHIVISCHVAATLPAFVANAQIGNFIRSGATIGSAFFGQGRLLRRGQVFQPFGRFLRSARADID